MADFETSSRHAAFDDPAIDAARFLGVPAELIDSQRPFALRLRDRLAGLAGDHSRRFACAANHFVGDRMHCVGARESWGCSPRFQADRRGVERFFRVGYAGDRRLSQRGLGHRADHRRLGSVRGLPPFACHEKPKSFVHLKSTSETFTAQPSAIALSAASASASARVRRRSQPSRADASRQLRHMRRSRLKRL